jgi:hypothetical protein
MREHALIDGSLLTRSRDSSLLLCLPNVYSCCLATNEARRYDAMSDSFTVWHGTEKTPLRLLLRNRGSMFRCYSSWWRKYVTIRDQLLFPSVPLVRIRTLVRVLLPRLLFTRNLTTTVTAFTSPHMELTCWRVHATKMTGSSSDNCIY